MFIFPPRQGGWRAARTQHCPLSKKDSGQSVREKEDLIKETGKNRCERRGMSEAEDRPVKGCRKSESGGWRVFV